MSIATPHVENFSCSLARRIITYKSSSRKNFRHVGNSAAATTTFHVNGTYQLSGDELTKS
ncbi:MAG: hypothetical protein SR1Q7_12160 [Quinella sp. 1Q7]|nr:hypothetical protein [Quinella sp. 1Q7]